jgi:lipopolysaccharide export system protein LptA
VLQLPSLAGANGAREANAYTTVTSDQVEMTRVDATATNDAYTKFTFDGNDKVSGTDLNVTCDTLEVFTDNVPAKPGEDPLLAATQVNQIQKLVARGKVDVIQTASGQGDGAQAYEARGARAEIRSRASVADQAPADNTPAEAYAYRSVELFGDPAGVEGPVRPTVVVPLLEGLGGDAGGGSQNPGKSAPTKTIITSDQQWLMTSAAGNTYYFSGNVQVDGGPLQASCDEMRAEVEPGSSVLKDIVAAGHVAIKQVNLQDTLQATAGRAEIKPGAQPEVTLSENAHVVDPAKGEDVSNADIIIQFDPNTHPSSHTVTMQQSSNLTGQKSNLRPTITFPNPAKPFDNAMNLRNKPSAGTSR